MICDHAGLLVTDQLTAVSSPVVKRHTPWNRKARVCDLWCEAFAPQTPKSRSEAPPYVPLHHHTRGHGMTHTLSAIALQPHHASCMVIHHDVCWWRTPRHGTTDRGLFSRGAKAHTVESEGESLRSMVRSLPTTASTISK